jgi:hypothetical protein
MKMKLIYVAAALFFSVPALVAQSPTSFDKSAFYSSMACSDTNRINEQLIIIVEASTLPEKNAYEGALMMKKADLIRGASGKLSLFKSGRKKLEASVKKNNSNAEFRFLRLMIQEHAPRLLGYNNNMQEDGDFIKKNYKELTEAVQRAVSEYCKKSKILDPSDFLISKNE